MPTKDLIQPAELRKQLDEQNNLLVLHVFDIKAFENEHIPGSLSAPAKNIEILDQLIHSKNRNIVIYDEDGYTSHLNIALNKLDGMGYHNVKVLDGGIKAWKEAGFSLNGKQHTEPEKV